MVDRFTEIEDVRQIEVMVGNLVYPHAELGFTIWLNNAMLLRPIIISISELAESVKSARRLYREQRRHGFRLDRSTKVVALGVSAAICA